MAFWLAVVLVAAKAASLGPPQSWAWVPDLARASFRDVLFALALAVCGEVCARVAGRKVRVWMLAAGAFCAFYSVVAYGVFQSFDRPLSFDLLRLMRGAAVKSSIADRLTWPIAVSMLAAPGLFWFAASRGFRWRILSPLAFAGMGAWIVTGALRAPYDEEAMRAKRLTLSPHVELLRSAFVGITGSRPVVIPREFPPEYQDEVRTFGDRGGAARMAFQPPAGVARPRNVIVVVLESVATKYLSLYGSRYATTPHLLEESKHALLFDNVHAHAPYTFCTFMCVNFSIYPGLPWRYAPGRLSVNGGPQGLPPTFASVLQSKGWRTAYLHNGDMDWGGEKYLIAGAGYDTVEDYHDFKAPELTSWGAEDRYLIDRLIAWIDEKPGQPFLAYCWTDQTHNPYLRRPGSQRLDFFHGQPPRAHPEALSRYLNVLHETDEHLARLFAALRQRGLADDTLVVITGDHGEAFGDPHDQQGHGFSVYQEEVNVPFFVWNPRLFPEGRHLATVGGHVDMNPTIADVLGIEPLDAWQGHSLFAPERPERTFFVASVDDYLLGMRDGNWKYIFEAATGNQLLFDLATDPDEQHNAVATQPERSARMKQRLAAWMAFEDRFMEGQPPVIAVSRKKE